MVEDEVGVVWKDIGGYEGLYRVSSNGEILSCERLVREHSGKAKHIKEHLKLQSIDAKGYHTVSLYKDGVEKIYLVHRLVASAFVPNPDDLPQVNHEDGNKHNNCASNLKWVTPSQNIEHAHNLGLIKKPTTGHIQRMSEASARARSIPVKCTDDGRVFSSMKDAAEYYNVSISSVNDSLRDGKSHCGHHFERMNRPKKLFNVPQQNVENAEKHYACPVLCVETGQVFESRGQAARLLNIPESSVYDSLRDGRSHRGYTFVNHIT